MRRAKRRRMPVLIGTLFGTLAAACWAAGFAAAKYGIGIGFSPADLAMHRYFWSGLLLIPLAMRQGVVTLGGIGWGRGLVLSDPVRPAAGDARLFRLHAGAARTRHDHSARLRNIGRAYPRKPRAARARDAAAHSRRCRSSSSVLSCSAWSR